MLSDLTPRRVFDLCPPLLDKERGKILEREADDTLKHPHVTDSEQRAPKRGANASLKRPYIINLEQGELKRGEASLIYPFPLPLGKGKGDKGGWGY